MDCKGDFDCHFVDNNCAVINGDIAPQQSPEYEEVGGSTVFCEHSATKNIACGSSLLIQPDDVMREETTDSRASSCAGQRRSGSIIPPSAEDFNCVTCDHIDSEKASENDRKCPGKLERRFSTGSLVQYVDEEDNDVIFYDTEMSSPFQPTSRVTTRTLSLSQNIIDAEARKCCRMYIRRNALCDPFRLPMPQCMRERLERENERRKSSIARRVSQFINHSLDLNREEDLI